MFLKNEQIVKQFLINYSIFLSSFQEIGKRLHFKLLNDKLQTQEDCI